MRRQASAARTDSITIGGWFAFASGWIATVRVVCFVARFGPWTGPFEWLNDICSMLQYLLGIPLALALYEVLRPRDQVLAGLATIIGITGMLAIVTLEILLLALVLTFAQQGGPVSFAVLVVGVWLVITGYLLRSVATFPHSLAISLLAVPYSGYPIWAFWMSSRLLPGARVNQGGSGTHQPPDDALAYYVG